MTTAETYTSRLNEFKALNAKRDTSKGHMQGLNLTQYYRINILHSYLLNTLEGKTDEEKRGFFESI